MSETDDTDTSDTFTSLKNGSTDSKAVAAYYDDWAETYDTTLESWNYQAPDEAAAKICAQLETDALILDVGCGTGLLAQALSKRLTCQLSGVDISAASLELAEKRGLYRRLKCHDLQITPLPFEDHEFDAAACVGVMTYIEKEADLLVDLCRIVRPGGYVLFTQRSDRWQDRDTQSIVMELETRNLWVVKDISKARPYLPKNEDFGDRIQVMHVLCQVL